jgi:inhibitor of KinA sporulation pathway (predicted exonuclease)
MICIPTSLVIFDSEFTAWEGSRDRDWQGENEYKEIIQLAAVRLEEEQGQFQIRETFNQLIVPNINPILSDYIVKLTGINQHLLDQTGVDFAAALNTFHVFSDLGHIPCYAWGNDDEILRENCSLNAIPLPIFARFTDLRQLAEQAGTAMADVSSGELANKLGMTLSGQTHNALHDVQSLTLALNYWVDNGLFQIEY